MERPRPRRRRGRGRRGRASRPDARTGSASPTSATQRRAGPGSRPSGPSSPSSPARGSPACARRPAPPPCSPAPASRPPAANWSRRSGARTPARWCCCRTTPSCAHTAAAAAEQARAEGVRVALIPTRSAVQGIAALAVHEPDRRFDEDVVAMTSAAGATRYAELAVAERQSWTMAGVCQAGDVLGLIDGDVAVIGADLTATARDGARPDARSPAANWSPWSSATDVPDALAERLEAARPRGPPRRRHRRLPGRPGSPRRCSSAWSEGPGAAACQRRGVQWIACPRSTNHSRRSLGPATAKVMAEQLDLHTVGDLLHHYPRRYAERGELTALADLPARRARDRRRPGRRRRAC